MHYLLKTCVTGDLDNANYAVVLCDYDFRKKIKNLKELCFDLFLQDDFFSASFFSDDICLVSDQAARKFPTYDKDFYDFVVAENYKITDEDIVNYVEYSILRIRKDGISWEIRTKDSDQEIITEEIPWYEFNV